MEYKQHGISDFDKQITKLLAQFADDIDKEDEKFPRYLELLETNYQIIGSAGKMAREIARSVQEEFPNFPMGSEAEEYLGSFPAEPEVFEFIRYCENTFNDGKDIREDIDRIRSVVKNVDGIGLQSAENRYRKELHRALRYEFQRPYVPDKEYGSNEELEDDIKNFLKESQEFRKGFGI